MLITFWRSIWFFGIVSDLNSKISLSVSQCKKEVCIVCLFIWFSLSQSHHHYPPPPPPPFSFLLGYMFCYQSPFSFLLGYLFCYQCFFCYLLSLPSSSQLEPVQVSDFTSSLLFTAGMICWYTVVYVRAVADKTIFLKTAHTHIRDIAQCNLQSLPKCNFYTGRNILYCFLFHFHEMCGTHTHTHTLSLSHINTCMHSSHVLWI